MCVAALPALGLGKTAAASFWTGLAIKGVTNIFQTIQQRKAAKQQADYQYEVARRTALYADRAFAAEQEATGARLREDKIALAKKRQKLAVQGAQARGKTVASERSGLLLDLLGMDQEMQLGGEAVDLAQTDVSLGRQYVRDIRGYEAKRDSRRNQALDARNRGYQIMSQAPTLLGAIGKTVGGGISSYYSLKGA